MEGEEDARPYEHGWHIDLMCRHLEAVTRGELTKLGVPNRLLFNVPPGTMKALDRDVPVLTTWGWKKHGDLQPGDFVFGPDGLPKRVEGVTPEALEESFEVIFDDDSSIIAGAGHLWEVDRDEMSVKPRYARGRKRKIVTTAELRASGYRHGTSGRRPDRIAVAEAVSLPPKRLIIDPYLLGAWIGDGSSTAAVIYAAEQDAEHFARLGRVTTINQPSGTRKQAFYHILIEGLARKLRVLNLIGNKHIPDDYLEASIEQRWALLQGLMDTDGHCSKGVCMFSAKGESLARSVLALARSLGLKATVRSHEAKIGAVSYGLHWTVQFTPPEGAQVFRLARKQQNVRGGRNGRSRNRYVVEVRPVGARPVKCIQVEGSMYLAGEALVPTHNSLLVMVFWLAWEWGPMGMAHIQFMATSYRLDFCKRDSRRFRKIVGSDWYRRLWPHVELVRANEQEVENARGGWRKSMPFKSLMGDRADRLGIDDPHSIDTAESDAERDKAIIRFREGATSRLNQPKVSAIVVVMQRLHQKDISGIILDRKMPYVHVRLPMRYEADKPCVTPFGRDPRKEEGELLFPARFPREVVDRDEEAMDSYAVAGQHQQRPGPRGGLIFKRHWLKVIPAAPLTTVWVRAWDLAATVKKTSAYTAGVKFGYDFELKKYVIGDMVRERVENVEPLLLNTASLDGYMVKVSIPQDPGQAGLVQVRALVKALAGYQVSASPESGDKTDRARPLASQAAVGNVVMVEGPWNEAFLDELTAFPTGRYRDQTDACSRGFAFFVHQPVPAFVGPTVVSTPYSPIGDFISPS